mgnify:FL=1
MQASAETAHTWQGNTQDHHRQISRVLLTKDPAVIVIVIILVAVLTLKISTLKMHPV